MPTHSFRIPSPTADLAAVRFGSGPPLLLVHALAFSKAYFAAAADVLSPHFDCVAFDQQGHGETVSRDPAAPLTPDVMAADIEAALDAIGWQRAAIGGISLGAATALAFARRRADRVSLLIQDLPAFGPSSFRDPGKSERMAEALARSAMEEAAGHSAEGLTPARAQAWKQALLEEWRRYDAAQLGPKLATAMRSTATWRIVERWPDDLKAVAVPTRILAIPGDPGHPYGVAKTMADTMPNAKLLPRVPSLAPAAIARQWVEVIRGSKQELWRA